MYEDFASVYDCLMDVSYEAFADGYERIFKEYGKTPEMLVDLGCGSGTLTTLMAKRGYEMIGVDASAEMLMLAREKAEDEGVSILYLQQDMSSFELYGTVDGAYSSLDSVNYLKKDEVDALFHWVNNYLMDDALFIFDINTPYKLQTVLGNHTFALEAEDVFCAWENEYHEEEKCTDFILNFFTEEENGLYSRHTETQTEWVHTVPEICELLRKNGLTVEKMLGDDMESAPNEASERVFFVAKAHNQNKEDALCVK